MKRVVVVGAGIIGLSSALAIAEDSNDVEIVVVAKEFPLEGQNVATYTTNKSGAHFRPFPSKSPEEYRDSKLARITYKRFKKLEKEFPETSVKFIKGYDFIEKEDPLYMNLAKGYTEEIDDFEVIDPSEYPNENVKFGAKYKTFAVYPQHYLLWLQQRLMMRYHAKMAQRNIGSLKEVSQLYPGSVIVNATGMGLTYEGGYDPLSYPIRGQVLLTRPPNAQALDKYLGQTITYQLENGDWSFVIPRPFDNGIIVGGTKVINSTNAEISSTERDLVVKNAKLRFPDLFDQNGDLEILQYSIGFRPAREGGVRLEREVVDNSVTIVHCYGFGGCGVEMSWGAAVNVSKLVNFKANL